MNVHDILGFLTLGWLGLRQARKAAEAAKSVTGFRQAARQDEMTGAEPEPQIRTAP